MYEVWQGDGEMIGDLAALSLIALVAGMFVVFIVARVVDAIQRRGDEK